MNTKEQADQLISEVCAYYGFDRSLLTRNGSYKPIRSLIVNNERIDISSIRMALALFISTYTDINNYVIGPMCGYQDHTTLVYIRKKGAYYIELEDFKFMPYWETVCNIAQKIGMTTRYIRIKPQKTKIMVDSTQINLAMSK